MIARSWRSLAPARRLLLPIACAALAGCGGSSNAGHLQKFFALERIYPVQETTATSMSSDGSVVGGWTNSVPGGEDAAVWGAPPYKWQKLPSTVPGGQGSCLAVSADGHWTAGTTNSPNFTQHAFRWSDGGGLEDLGALGNDYSEACGISGDGSVVVGFSPPPNGALHAFRWTDGAGLEDLGTLGGDYSRANAVSADGSRVVGTAMIAGNVPTHPFLWTSSGGMVDLEPASAGNGAATAISADGLCIVGYHGDGISIAFKWTQASGVMELPLLHPGEASAAAAVSADGSVIAGGSGTTAVIWTSNGVVDLNAAFSDRIPPGWVLVDATALSSSGRFVAGNATFGGHHRAYVMDLAP